MNGGDYTDNLTKIVAAAAKVFAHWGLHRTKVKDVAAEAGVAAGTVYLYADSKDSLFDLALRFGMGYEISEVAQNEIPYSTNRQDTFKWLVKVARLDDLLPELHEPMLNECPLYELLGILFDFLSDHKFAIRIVERSAHEWQELATLFFSEIRDPVIKRIGKRISFENSTLSPDECETMARLVGGAIAFAAVHRFFEGGLPDTTEKSLYKKVVIRSLVKMISEKKA